MKNLLLGRRAFGGLTASLFAPAVLAADPVASWPDRPVRIVVPFGAGGAVDTLIRAFGQRFSEYANGQPLVVENRSGAGGMVGGAYAASQPPDGYTLFAADVSPNVVGKELNPKASFDPMTSFTPIMHLVNLHAVLLRNPNVKETTVPEIIAAAKKKPEGFVYSSSGIGNGAHLFMALLEREAGVKMVHVPYRSGAETVTAVARGDAQFCFPSLSSSLPMIKGGQVIPVALGAGPSPILPGIPLMHDTIPGFDVAVWYGVAGPAGMNPALADKINGIFGKIAALPDIRKMVEENQGGAIVGGSRQDFAAFLNREYERWTPIIRAGGIRTE
ncbi:tripartite tricarboxylate transporter substrate binding protein [Acetobacteraceae bacterium H6797]|nr:tripartite tricarboxylate transporter substrate binding protein [Acetobacteraceae bacterium H6797]